MFEMTLVVLIIGIMGAVLIPLMGNNLNYSRLPTAANVLAADIEFCSSECITHPTNPPSRQIVFDVDNNKYTIQDASGNTITHPSDSLPYVNDFSTGRNLRFEGVSIRQITGGGAILTFDAYGRPLITEDMAIQLQYTTSTMTVTIQKGTGETTITSP